MNYNQELEKWREARGITPYSQYPGLVGNLLEEVTELMRAKNLDGVVDALLDYSVFLANAMPMLIDLDQELNEEEMKEVEAKKKPYADLDTPSLNCYKNYLMFKLLDGVKSASFLTGQDITSIFALQKKIDNNEEKMMDEINKCNDSHIRYLNSLYRLIKASIMVAGYDFDKAFEEVFKAIHSRKGHWDDKINKFVKDPDQPDRYEPNYEHTKIR